AQMSKALCIQENDMQETGKIHYVEIPSRNLEATKAIFTSAFGWSFVDYGPEYVAIENAGIDGGFYKSDKVCSPEGGRVLVVLSSAGLDEAVENVTSSGGKVLQGIFDLPGSRRFLFTVPNRNEYAVW